MDCRGFDRLPNHVYPVSYSHFAYIVWNNFTSANEFTGVHNLYDIDDAWCSDRFDSVSRRGTNHFRVQLFNPDRKPRCDKMWA